MNKSILSLIFFVEIWVLPSAFAQEKIIISSTKDQGLVSYSPTAAENGPDSCQIKLTKSTGATILERQGNLIKIRFDDNSRGGCYWDQIKGRDMQEGWVQSNDLDYQATDTDASPSSAPASSVRPKPRPEGWVKADEVAISSAENDVVIRPKARPEFLAPGCVPTDEFKPHRAVRELRDVIKNEASGVKSPHEIDKYMECYPLTDQGLKNYNEYKPMMDIVYDTFRGSVGEGYMDINPSLYKCLMRRESGFDPEAGSHTGAAGLGQHTSINIEHIDKRLNTKDSWESILWKRFFDSASQTSTGRKLLQECPQTKGGKTPKFASKEDARCPLNSMAASAIYNLQVQRALRAKSKVAKVEFENEMDYQLAIGAAYNLGHGAAASAIEDLDVNGWLAAIPAKAKTDAKKEEVEKHISALRNCMEEDNWKPMHEGDKPRCEL